MAQCMLPEASEASGRRAGRQAGGQAGRQAGWLAGWLAGWQAGRHAPMRVMPEASGLLGTHLPPTTAPAGSALLRCWDPTCRQEDRGRQDDQGDVSGSGQPWATRHPPPPQASGAAAVGRTPLLWHGLLLPPSLARSIAPSLFPRSLARLGLLAILQVGHNGHRVGGREVLEVLVSEALHAARVVGHRNHGRVDARPHALHLAQREHAVLRGGGGQRGAGAEGQCGVVRRATRLCLLICRPPRNITP